MDEFAGAMRFRLGVERFQGGADGTGGYVGQWQAGAPVWGDLKPVGDHPLVEGEDRSSRPRFRVATRAVGLDLTCRLRLGARAFAVLSVVNDPRTPDRQSLLVEEIRP